MFDTLAVSTHLGRAGRWACWLVFVVAVALLPLRLAPAAFADEVVTAPSVCTLDAGGNVDCPHLYAAPNLFSTGDLLAAKPATAAALLRLQEQAIDDTLAAHKLPASDRGAVMTWGRSEAQAQLWSLVYAALTTEAAERTADQQAVVEWMNGMLRGQATASAASAAREYVKWAGLDQNLFTSMVRSGAGEDELRAFLSGPVVNFNQDRTAGYCEYHSPAPYEDEYKGRTSQMCFTDCTQVCGAPTPKFEQFVQWGQATLPSPQLDPAYVQNAAAIAIGATYGATALALPPIVIGTYAAAMAVITELGIAVYAMPLAHTASAFGMTVVGAGGVLEASVLATDLASIGGTATSTGAEVAGLVLENAEFVMSAGWEAAAAASAASIAATVGVVIAALVTIVLASIKFRDDLELPGKLAAAIQAARTTTPQDAGALAATESGVSTLFELFAGSTFPRPRPTTCENPVLPHYGYYDESGQFKHWEMDLTADLCLNPTPVPAAAATDPHFVIQGGPFNSAAPIRISSSISHTNAVSGLTQQTRVSGNWFVQRFAVASPATVEWTREGLGLSLDYTDWSSAPQHAWVVRDPEGGYEFAGMTGEQGGTSAATCKADGTCWHDSEIRYVGPDGKNYSARLENDQPSTGSPVMTTTDPLSASPVGFSANDFAPGNAVGPITYQWRFQLAECGGRLPCISRTSFGPAYSDPVAGESAAFTWQTSGTFAVELTATDAQGKSATTTMSAEIGSAPPTLSLSPACAGDSQTGCDDHNASTGERLTVTGSITHPGTVDTETVTVDWGDETPPVTLSAGPGVISDYYDTIHFTANTANRLDLAATHTYTAPGVYYGKVTVRDLAGNIDENVFVESVRGPQIVTFGALPDRRYGQAFTAQATGTDSGFPVTFTAGPDEVCTAAGADGSRITPVGLGTCWVTARQAGGGPIYGNAIPVWRSFEVTKAQIEIRPEPKTKVYGAPNPEFTAQFVPLVNGDTAEDFPGLVVTGPPADSGVGRYDVVASGASNPNYDIHYVTGRLDIERAELTVTPEDKTRVYGDPLPTYTASFGGLVNDDTGADITGLRFDGPPKDASVGERDILAFGATNPNYHYTYRTGTETITPAPLRITAQDVTRRYGGPANYTATYDGLVNGEHDLHGLTYAGADPRAGVGTYPIVISGTPDSRYANYDITYVEGTEQVTPAPLSIKATDKTRRYGAPSPTYTTVLDGLTNFDTRDQLPGLTVTGAPAKAGVGTYPIEPTGAVNPNYDISYANGTETVTRAPLGITAENKSKVYGAPDPLFTATYDGLVNGDTPTAVDGLGFTTTPTGSDAGTYPIVPSGATSPNYQIGYTNGTETITPAALTINAADKTTRYGTVPTAYTWTGQGWVNGDTDTTIGTAPACRATIQGAAPTATTNPGAYLGAITCAGAADPNYTIGYANGQLTVNPVIRLSQTGLPTTVPQQAIIDGQPITLPTGEVELGYGTTHSYAFPAVVTDPNGVVYLTTASGFSGPVTSNATVNATYTTMTNIVAAATASGGIDANQVNPLKTKWTTVQNYLRAGNLTAARTALHDFATLVRSQSGKKIKKPTADTLIAYAQTVYTSIGGTGTV